MTVLVARTTYVKSQVRNSLMNILNRPGHQAWLQPSLALAIRILRKLLFMVSKFQARLNQHHSEAHQAALRPGGDRWNEALDRYYRQLRSIQGSLSKKPLISIIMPVYKTPLKYLNECLASVAAQVYDRWELCIVDDGSQDSNVEDLLKQFAKQNPGKVKLLIENRNQGICIASQLALDQAQGDYIALLDHDDRLLPNALLEVTRTINASSEPDIIYSDEARINEDGIVESCFYKPDWSPLFSFAAHYSTHLTVFKTSLVRSVGGFRTGFDGSQDHDLMLRAVEASPRPVVHIPMILYQWRAHAQSTARSRDAKPYAAEAGVKAVSEACIRRGWPAQVKFDAKFERYRVRFDLKDPNILISIIIPSKDALDVLEPCLNSIFNKTTYPNFEIILIDHDSKSDAVLRLFKRMEANFADKFKCLSYTGEFNFAVMNNQAARAARGEYLLFLNNDTEVESPSWLEEMLSIAQLPTTGAVGAKLLFENRRIQHAGIVGLGKGVAGNAGVGLPHDSNHYYSYFQTTHEVLAVTGACLLVQKEKFDLVYGFNETDVPSGYGDVDLCLRLREKGFVNVYVPHAILLHKESSTRKAGVEVYEKWYMLNRWGKELATDPYLNPNLLMTTQYQIDFDSLFQQPLEPLFKQILKPNLV